MITVDHIITNANIYTQNAEHPTVRALAIKNGRIVAMGNTYDIRTLADGRVPETNADGRLIIPGLTDAHIHWQNYARKLQSVDLVDVPTKAEAIRRVAEKIEQTPVGEWVIGIGWRKDLWEGGRFPTAADLDAVSPQHPVYLISRSGHAAWVNTKAMTLAQIPLDIDDPAGGGFVRDESGAPSGVLLEAPAMRYVSELMPKTSDEQMADWMEYAQTQALKMGLTGFHDYDRPSCLRALQIVRERGNLHMRAVKNVNAEWIEHAYELGVRSGFGDEWLRFGGLKIFADGALGPQTAAMVEPYVGNSNNFGIVITDKEETLELVSKASANGWSATIHAIGDKAVHDVLDVFETVRQQEAASGIAREQRRHRIEHVQVTLPEDAARLAVLDVIASMQPIHATSDYEMVDLYWGQRAVYSYAMKSQLNHGAVLALGSDAPLDDIDPLAGIHAAVTRRRADGSPQPDGWYPAERLTLEESIHGYTAGAAYAGMMENDLGQIAPGYLADLVMLDRDIFDIDPMGILETKVLGTMVGGEWRFREFD